MLSLLQQWYEFAGIIIALPIAVTGVWAIIRAGRHLGTLHEAITGRAEGPANERVPSMIERFHKIDDHLARQDAELEKINAELSYNGGSSTKDQVRKLVSGQEAAAETAAAVRRTLDAK